MASGGGATNPRRRRRTSRSRSRAGAKFFGVSVPPVKTLVAGVAGMAAVRALPGIIAMRLPALPTVGAPGLAVRAAIALFGGRLVAATAGVQAGKDFTLGGMLSVADELARTYVLPNIGLGAYLPTHADDPFGAYLPGGEKTKYDIAPGRSVMPARLDAAQRFG